MIDRMVYFQYNIAAPVNDDDCEEEDDEDDEYGGGGKKKEDLESDDPVERKHASSHYSRDFRGLKMDAFLCLKFHFEEEENWRS